jgi:hypothetical protein
MKARPDGGNIGSHTTDVNLEQFWKAAYPIRVTPLGIIIDSRLEQFLKE